MDDSFIANLSNPEQPIPGGGAAAAHAGLVGLALLEKIIRLEMRRHLGASEDVPWETLLEKVSGLTRSLYWFRDEDGRSYMRLAEAKACGKGEAEVLAALRKAIDCPMEIMEQTREALSCAVQAAKHCKGHLLSDLQVVCELLGAAGRSAWHIARANLRLMEDPIVQDDYQSRLAGLYDNSREARRLAEAAILGRKC